MQKKKKSNNHSEQSFYTQHHTIFTHYLHILGFENSHFM